MVFHHLRLSKYRRRSTDRLRSMMTMFLCYVILVATIGPAQAMVVCVGANGHIDIELALDSCCSSPRIQNLPDGVHCNATAHGCAGCTDLQLSTPLTPNNVQRLRPLRQCFAEVPASTTRLLSCDHFTKQREYSVPPPPPTLEVLATVLLLI
jgi:hypothetical protein